MNGLKMSRGASVRQMRWQTRSALAMYRAARQATGLAIRQSLLRHRATVVASVRAALVAPNPALVNPHCTSDGPRDHLAGPNGTSSSPPAERSSVWELWAPERRATTQASDRSDELLQVVKVIHDHPEGICARDIGNELGTDWRRVLGLTRSLVEAGLVEQVEQAYYPVARAGR